MQSVVAEWQLLADLSFADFFLWVPLEGPRFLCVAQARPTTAPTIHPEDAVGSTIYHDDHPQLSMAMSQARIYDEEDSDPAATPAVRREAIPVRWNDRVIAVLSRNTDLALLKMPSPLEVAYLNSAADLCQMIADGSFPTRELTSDVHTSPRVGDGLIRLDLTGTVVFASPNALSAYHRMGHEFDLVGTDLASLTRSLIGDPFDAVEVAQRITLAVAGQPSMRIEAESRRGAAVLFRALPLRPSGGAEGALVLCRDVTEVRRRDRALMSKDATIREIHHRVKNNLQTVAALLRLQSRRTTSQEAREVLAESVRRVTSIALVHETLSMSVDERLNLDEVIDKVIPIMSDVAATDSRVIVRKEGKLGVVSAELATPLVMVLTELVQNAFEHAYSPGQHGEVVVRADRSAKWLDVAISDDGVGLPNDFSLDQTDRLGLQIVRTLVESELRGSLSLHNRLSGGAEAVLRVPLTTRR